MKIALLDPGLVTLKGHHFDLDLRLLRALQRRGHDVVVHGFVRPSPGLEQAAGAAGMRLEKTFRVVPYVSLPKNRTSADAHRELEDATAEDLLRVEKDALWFWPTLTAYQLAAGIRAGAGVRQVGGTWWTPRMPLAAGAASWAESTRRLRAGEADFLVGAYDELLCQRCTSFSSGLTLHRLPCPHDGAPNAARPEALRTVGFFGHQRAARGIDVMPGLIDALLRRGYEVVVQDSGGEMAIRGDHPRLRVLRFIEDFPAELARCDVVVWPSRWQAYAESWSGVVCEAIATGVPVVVPSGCLPGELVARYEAGTFFHEYSVASILSALEAAAAAFPRLASDAREAARRWKADHGTLRLVQWIEAHSGVDA